MKSSFLVSIVLSALVSMSALGQTNRAKKVQQKATPKTTTTTAPAKQTTSSQSVATTSAAEKTSFQKFYDRLSIGYFGVFTSPTLEDWDSSNAAISPQLGDTEKRCRKNCDSYAMNMWNQVNFAYDFGWIMKFVIIPRWTVHFVNPRDMNRGVGEDRAMIGLEDFLVGFAGTVVASEDKKFNWFIRPAMRLPTSHFSRNFNQADSAKKPGVGDLTQNLELAHFITYDFNPEWQVGFQLQQRMWVYEDRYNLTRFRYITVPYISYAIRETTKIQMYYQNMIENNKRWESVNGKKPAYKDIYQDVLLGVSQDVTKTVNVTPYVGFFIDDIPHSMRSAYLGAWISWKIK